MSSPSLANYGVNSLDELTLTPTRTNFISTLSETFAANPQASGVVIHFRITGLPTYKKNNSQEALNLLLKQVVKITTEVLGKNTLISRDSLDAFSVFIADIEMPYTKIAATQLQKTLQDTLRDTAHQSLTVNLGFALYPEHSKSAATLHTYASAASEVAKTNQAELLSHSKRYERSGADLVFAQLRTKNFCGRLGELDIFHEELAVSKESVGAIIIEGEAGVGRSMLISKMYEIVKSSGRAAAVAHLHKAQREVPYSGLVSVLNSLYSQSRFHDIFFDGCSDDELLELKRLFVSLGLEVGEIPPPPEDSEDAKSRLKNLGGGFLGILETLMPHGPITLLFDDAEFLDTKSVEMLMELISKIPSGLLIIASLTTAPLQDDSLLKHALAHSSAHIRSRELRLARLDLDTCIELDSFVLAHTNPSPALTQKLFGISSGNPLFHKLLLLYLAIHQRVTGSVGNLELEFDPDTMPKTLPKMCEAIFEVLPRTIYETLVAASAASLPVSSESLARALGNSDYQTASDTDWLARLGLLVRSELHPHSITSAHSSISKLALESVEPDLLDVLHLSFAITASQSSNSTAVTLYHYQHSLNEEATQKAQEAFNSEFGWLTQTVTPELLATEHAHAPLVNNMGEVKTPPIISPLEDIKSVPITERATAVIPAPVTPLRSEKSESSGSTPPKATSALGNPVDDKTIPQKTMLDSLTPDSIISVEGIPSGPNPVLINTEEDTEHVFGAIEKLLAENERATVAAVLWRILASFEIQDFEGRQFLAAHLERIENFVKEVRLSESYRALEDTLVRELRREDDSELKLVYAGSAVRAVLMFLETGRYNSVVRLGRVISRRDEEIKQAVAKQLTSSHFADILMSDLQSNSFEHSSGAAVAARQWAEVISSRLLHILRREPNYRTRHAAAKALGEGAPAVAHKAASELLETINEEEYANVLSVIDALGIDDNLAEDLVVKAFCSTSKDVHMIACSVAFRMPSSALGIMQRAVNENGTSGKLRTLEAIGHLRLVDALPVVNHKIVNSIIPAVIATAATAVGRISLDADCPELKAVRMLETAATRLLKLALTEEDREQEEIESAFQTVLSTLAKFKIPEVATTLTELRDEVDKLKAASPAHLNIGEIEQALGIAQAKINTPEPEPTESE